MYRTLTYSLYLADYIIRCMAEMAKK